MIARFEETSQAKQAGDLTGVIDRTKNKPEIIGVLLIVALSVILFLIGFFLGEDGFGGNIRADLYLFHEPAIWAFRNRPMMQVLPNYNSATTPLFHILESHNPLLGHDAAFRFTNVLFALSTCGLFIFAIFRRFQSAKDVRMSAILIGTSILFSPYYRAESFWVSTDVLPVFLIIVTAILLNPVQDSSPSDRLAVNVWVLTPLLALVSWSCFYCRQTDLFLPFYAFTILLWRFRAHRWWIFLFFGILGMPMLYLVHIWKGLTPPGFRRHEGFSVDAIVQPLSMILIYALPFFFHSLTEMKMLSIKGSKLFSASLYLLVGLIGFLGIFHHFHFYEDNRGGGIASKFLAHYGEPGRYLFLVVSYLGLVIVLLLCQRASWRGRALMASFLLPSFVMTFFFQRYYDPVLFVLFLLFWERSAVIRFLTPRMGYILIGFNVTLLIGALVYNGRTEPVFLPLASHPRPWDEINQY
jgi:hypothetical protein